MCLPFLHTWAKWEQYEWRGISYGPAFCKSEPREVSYRRQRRHCEECNKEQDELVRTG